MTSQCLKLAPQSHDEITDHLDLMLASPDFRATPQQVALLKYVVNQTLAGNADNIKGYTVATEVLGRRQDFDQNIDPIVSIQAARLRRELARYYQAAGRDNRIRINIPKGSYVPVFEARPHAQATGTKIDKVHADIRARKSWPSVFVQPAHNFSGDPKHDNWITGLAADLTDELNRYPDIRVMSLDLDNPKTAPDKYTARFVIDGSVRSDRTCIKVILRLTDIRTNRQIWSNSYRSSVETAGTIAFQEKIARVVAVNVAGKRGGIAKALARDSKSHSPQFPQAYEAILRYYDYRSASTPEAFQRALTAIEKAVASDPECGQVWTIRARLFAEIYALDIPGFDRPLEQALAFGLNGLRLLPDDQRSHSIMAFIHLLRNDLKTGLAEAKRALQLGPETLFVLDGIGYLMTLMGDWERGLALIEKVIRLNPFYSNYVHYALWLNGLRQKDDNRAWQETMKLNRPAHFWDHLAKSATLGLRGHIEEGRRTAADLLKLKPDFPERGRTLIRHFIKFEDIVDRVIAGLYAVGIEVK